ncbi:ead/Ea22-like family protein [Citrobacter portucalensis]|uniref:ead/Ea22-like family protein n=1 Tax=Citrobacter portucalensis TaxID=1639133 RepID=UPI00351D3FEE
MTLNKQALRGQSVEGSYYLVECCNCGEMYPSNILDGGEAIADSGDYGDCYCHMCGADDTERADWGDVNSNEAKAWNFQQKRIEALLDELEAANHTAAVDHEAACSLVEENEEVKRKLEATEKQNAELRLKSRLLENADRDIAALRQRIAELEARTVNLSKLSVGEVMYVSGFSRDYAEGWCAGNDNAIHEIRAAGIGVKGE